LVEVSERVLEEAVVAAAEEEEDLQFGNLAEDPGHTVGPEDQCMIALPAVAESPRAGLA